MSVISIIPSRYGSSRFPGKSLALISGKPMIQWVFEGVSQSEIVDRVYVATDNQRIYQCVKSFGGDALMTSEKHTCGTERIAECVEALSLNDEDIVLNIQGDEPLITSEMIQDLFSAFNDSDVYMSTLKKQIDDNLELNNTNVVKVITDIKNDAIYFSRYCIPFERDGRPVIHYKHIGAYGYKVWFLKQYVKMIKTELEISESLEQLRVIEHGMKIRVVETKCQTIGVDTPDQIAKVEMELNKRRMAHE